MMPKKISRGPSLLMMMTVAVMIIWELRIFLHAAQVAILVYFMGLQKIKQVICTLLLLRGHIREER